MYIYHINIILTNNFLNKKNNIKHICSNISWNLHTQNPGNILKIVS